MCLQRKLGTFDFAVKRRIRRGSGLKILNFENDKLNTIIYPEELKMNFWSSAVSEEIGFKSFRYQSGYHIYLDLSGIENNLDYFLKKCEKVAIVQVDYFGKICAGYEGFGSPVVVAGLICPRKIIDVVTRN